MADINIYGVLHNATPDNTIARAEQIKDETQGKDQATINQEVKTKLDGMTSPKVLLCGDISGIDSWDSGTDLKDTVFAGITWDDILAADVVLFGTKTGSKYSYVTPIYIEAYGYYGVMCLPDYYHGQQVLVNLGNGMGDNRDFTVGDITKKVLITENEKSQIGVKEIVADDKYIAICNLTTESSAENIENAFPTELKTAIQDSRTTDYLVYHVFNGMVGSTIVSVRNDSLNYAFDFTSIQGSVVNGVRVKFTSWEYDFSTVKIEKAFSIDLATIGNTEKHVIKIEKVSGHGGSATLPYDDLPGNGDYLRVAYSDNSHEYISYTDLLQFTGGGFSQGSSNSSALSLYIPNTEKHLAKSTAKGIYTKDIDTEIYNNNTSSTTITINPLSLGNRYNKWNEVAELNITLGTDASKSDLSNPLLAEYAFEFVSGSTPTVLTITPEPKWVGSHEIEANKTYQVSIVNGIGVIVGVDNTVANEEVEL